MPLDSLYTRFDYSSTQIKYQLNENQSWKIEYVKQRAKCFTPDAIKSIAYRPFDERMIYYHDLFIERPRREVMQHFLNGENIGLITARSNKSETCDHFFLTKNIMETKCGERTTQSAVFPLYLYPNANNLRTFGANNKGKPNLNTDIAEQIATGLGLRFANEKEQNTNTFAPIDLLDYIYAVLHSPTYRETYKEFLKIDFPRIPYPKDSKSFWQLVQFGSRLRQIHLLESSVVEDYITSYPKDGNNIVTRRIIQKDWELYDTDK